MKNRAIIFLTTSICLLTLISISCKSEKTTPPVLTVIAPVFLPVSGKYSTDQVVSISTITPGATIYYTTNGNTPTTASTQYIQGNPLTISGNGTSTVIKAIAAKAGMNNSAIFEGTFLIEYNNSIFVDPSEPVSGTGTLTSPFNTWTDVTFQPGYTYLQKRGTIARDQLDVNMAAPVGSPIVLGAYGTGNAPIIQGSEIETGWVLESGNIYRKTITTGTGSLGMIAEDGVVLSSVQWDTDPATTLAKMSQASFSFNNTAETMYVWCSNDASPDSHTMEVSRRNFGIHGDNASYITIQDLHIRYVSIHGIAFGDSNHITVNNCVIEKLGGAIIFADVPAGNGIEFGNSSSDCMVQNCTISDIFDSGISPQTYSANQTASNFTFINNTVSRCGFAGVEIVALVYSAADPQWVNCSISNIIVSNSTITDSGKGWSGIRWLSLGGEGRGIKVSAIITSTDNTRSISGVSIEQCTITGCAGEGIYLGGRSGTVNISRCTIDNNTRNGILVQEPETTNLQVNLISSIISNNGFGTTNENGVAYNVTDGGGFNLYHNTFYNNNQSSFLVWEHSGNANLVNNIFHASSQRFHLLFGYTLTGASLNNNYFTQFGAANNIIGYDLNGTLATYDTASAFTTAHTFASNNIGGTDPLLNAGFTLQSTSSSCYQQGNNSTGVTIDYSGNNYLNPPTIGAFEWQ